MVLAWIRSVEPQVNSDKLGNDLHSYAQMLDPNDSLRRSSHGRLFQDGISRSVSSIKGEFLVISMFCCRDDPSDLLKTCKQTIFGRICNFTSQYGQDSEVYSFYYSLSTKEDSEMLPSVRLCTVYLKI